MKKVQKKERIGSNEYRYTVIYEPEENNNGYMVTVPVLPGLVTYGRDLPEAREMATDAIVCYIEGLLKNNEEVPVENNLVQEQVLVSV